MLGRTSYSGAYVDACRARVDRQVAAYRELASAAGSDGRLGGALASFAPEFFNNMVITLDGYFMHRVRGAEGKDGNPLNEVRVVCQSLMQNGGVLTADTTIRLEPGASILGYAEGDRIAIDAEGFVRLAAGCFAEIERKYPEKVAS